MQHLDRLVSQCDRRIEKNRERAEQQMAISEEDVKRIAVLQEQIQDATDKCERAAEKDDIDSSMAFLHEADQLNDALQKIMYPYMEKRITVCEISGNFVSNRFEVQ
jgi:hypothetical protein